MKRQGDCPQRGQSPCALKRLWLSRGGAFAASLHFTDRNGPVLLQGAGGGHSHQNRIQSVHSGDRRLAILNHRVGKGLHL